MPSEFPTILEARSQRVTHKKGRFSHLQVILTRLSPSDTPPTLARASVTRPLHPPQGPALPGGARCRGAYRCHQFVRANQPLVHDHKCFVLRDTRLGENHSPVEVCDHMLVVSIGCTSRREERLPHRPYSARLERLRWLGARWRCQTTLPVRRRPIVACDDNLHRCDKSTAPPCSTMPQTIPP